jgi:hypothetical protein
MGHHSTLSDAREELLTREGFIWNSHKGKGGGTSLLQPSDGYSLTHFVPFALFVLIAAWSEQFQKLEEYYLLHGHCNVPFTPSPTPTEDGSPKGPHTSDYASLHTWCKHQRRHYRRYYEFGKEKSTLTEYQIRQLESVGFGWNVPINNNSSNKNNN